MALIEVKNLAKIYNEDGLETPALVDVSFNIERGEFVAIIGPSGSGKSTLLHILGFLDKPTSGEYFFAGKNVKEYNEDEAAAIRNQRIGFIFQAFNLLARTTVLDNVKLPLLYSNVPETEWEGKAAEAIEAVGLSQRLKHETSQLSGGERQRVAIARALVLNPQVIFADEPTGNLDSKSGQKVMEILQRLHTETGHTIILITHETYTAHYAQRLITIKDGRIESNRPVAHRLTGNDFVK